jgi:hypothetical protein
MAKFDFLGPKSSSGSHKVARRWHACKSSNLQRETFSYRISLASHLCGLSLGFEGSMLRLWSNSSEIEEGVSLWKARAASRSK